MIIITADDYGKDIRTTDNIFKCGLNKRVSSASAMVFMADSERAASLLKELDLEIGLHLNFTQPFNGSHVSRTVRQHQKKIIAYLNMHPLTQIIYNPFLTKSFILVFQTQQGEFRRLYGKLPDFYNGHHHMHLCTNMILGKMLPTNARIRRTFSFNSGEKGIFNLSYRDLLNWLISKKFISTDSLFSISPVQDIQRLHTFFVRAQTENVEIEVHPEIEEECKFLLSEQFKKLLDIALLSGFCHLSKIDTSGDSIEIK